MISDNQTGRLCPLLKTACIKDACAWSDFYAGEPGTCLLWIYLYKTNRIENSIKGVTDSLDALKRHLDETYFRSALIVTEPD